MGKVSNEYGIFDDKGIQYGYTYDNISDINDAIYDWRGDMPDTNLHIRSRSVTYGDWK